MDKPTGRYVVVMIDTEESRTIYGVYEAPSMSAAVNLRRTLEAEADDASIDNARGIICQLLQHQPPTAS